MGGGVQHTHSGGEPEKKPRSGGQPAKFKGLPPIKSPKIPKDHRAVLVACTATGRASWAELEPVREGYKFVRNVAAVPDLEAAKGGGGPGGSSEANNIPSGQVFWGGWSCGVCEASSTRVPGHEGRILWQCRRCETIYCPGGFEKTGGESWSVVCPGCGDTHTLIAHQEAPTISEFGTQSGSGREGKGLDSGSQQRKGISGGGSGELRQR